MLTGGDVSSGYRVDFHTHVVVQPPDFAERFGDRRWPTFNAADGVLSRDGQAVRRVAPTAWLPARRIEDMDSAGVDRQVLSPIPPLICDWGEPQVSAEWADRLNEAVAGVVRDYPTRFSGLGTVPLHHPGQAPEVLERAHRLGLSGVEIGTTGGPRELDHPDLREFFAAAEQLGMLIFVHPLLLGAEVDWTSRIAGPASNFGLGMGTDTAIAASRMVFGGLTRDCPRLRVCLAHGGGTFVWALSRIAHVWDQTNDLKSADLTGNVYVDSVVYQPANLRYLCERLGPDRILFGTDYPLPAQDDIGGSILTGLAESDARMIAGATAARLLGLAVTPSD